MFAIHFFKKVADNENDEINYENIPKTDEINMSVTYGCWRLTDSYRFLSSNLHKLTKAFFDIKHKSIKNFEEEADNDFFSNKIEEIVLLITNEKYENESIEISGKVFQIKRKIKRYDIGKYIWK